MIRFLRIRHLAVIDALELEFEPGLTVLTGETGAGKSIIIEALSLLLGARASADLVRTGETQASIEAVFETTDHRELLVRREITAQGRTRAFIDDTLATTMALRELGARMVDLHGQHEHQLLLDPATHLDVLDEYGNLGSHRAGVADAFRRFKTIRDELEQLRSADRDRDTRAEFIAFQLDELDRVAPAPDEDVELATTRQVLANADKLQRLCADAYARLYEGDEAVLPALATVWKRVGELETLDPRFASHLEAREAIKSHLEDLAFHLRDYAASIDASPERLQEVEARLAQLERVKRKYGPTLRDVLTRRDSLRQDLTTLDETSERAASLEAGLERARTAYLAAADTLGAERRRHASTFTRRLQGLLAELAMERTRCDVRFATGSAAEGAWTERGVDQAEFFMSPNPGEDLRPLSKIASGGELSRIMLALKTLAATDAPGKTLVFDEVDAGIGGRVADVLGRRLRELGERYQVICITHLPQIATCGVTHLVVSKGVRGGRTATHVDRLEGEARVDEIARMMAGAQLSDHVRTSARELLARRADSSTLRQAQGRPERSQEATSSGASPGQPNSEHKANIAGPRSKGGVKGQRG